MTYVWCEEVRYASPWSFQSQTIDQEDKKNQIRKSSCYVHYLKKNTNTSEVMFEFALDWNSSHFVHDHAHNCTRIRLWCQDK